jgi:hypothetical protein
VNAGTDQILAANTTSVTLQGTGSDPEGNAVTYSWTKVSGPAVTFSSTTIANPVITGLTNGSTYVFQLTVSDGTLTSADQVQVTVGTVSNPNALTAYPAGTITVNGNLNESNWNLSGSIAKTTIGSPNNTATFGVLWDNNNLYIGVKVLDAALYNDSPDSWDNDAVEIFIDANNNKLSSFDGMDNQFIKAYNSSTLFSKVAVTGVQHAYAAISGGYTVEISIPWSQLGLTPAAGLTIGFDAGYDDDDNGGTRDAQAVWAGTINNYQSTADYGTVVLSAALPAALAVAVAPSKINLPGMKILPNPAVDGKAKVLISGNTANGHLFVYDLNGKQVYTAKAQAEMLLNLQQLPKGVYVVKYVIGDKSFTKKLLIQ